jgi:peptidoglycan/LPS O-acetylase OafA/YrhL
MPSRNSIGFLRFFFAVLVILSHSYPLGGFGPDPLAARGAPETLGGIAVAGFFVLSGALIAQSWTRTPSLWRFLWHRFLRVFPAFWACLLTTILVFAPLVGKIERGTLEQYWTWPVNPPLGYLRLNAWLHINQYGIAGLLAKNPHPYAFDGSLWSLEYEFICYLGVAILGLSGVLNRHRWGRGVVLLLLGVCIAVATRASWQPDHHPFDGTLFLLGGYFLAGVAYHQWRDRTPLQGKLGLASAALTVASAPLGVYHYVAPITCGYLVLWLGAALPFKNFDKNADFSYGLYIYAFPVQQLLAVLNWRHHGAGQFFLTSVALTLPLAVASYYLVERPCLRKKNLMLRMNYVAVAVDRVRRW